MAKRKGIASLEGIVQVIYEVRGHRVMLDADLAMLYRVPTKRLNEQVRRNRNRFPDDFMFCLSATERDHLRSQIATSSSWGGRRTLPYAFTEHGAVMLASVLNSKAAIHMSIQVVRAFVRMRRMLSGQRELARRLAQLEQKVGGHDGEIGALFAAIKQLMMAPAPHKRRIGF